MFRLEVAMHDPFGVHDFEPLKNALHDHLDFEGGELVAVLDFVVELSSFKQFDADVDGVV